MKYLSNFNSLEFGGKFHDFGEEIKPRKGEQAALDVLIREGRVTAVGDEDPMQPAPAEAGDEDELPVLSGMSKEKLLAQAETEGVEIETDDNKADIIRKIEAKRSGEGA
jgi:hypothetical protein